MSDKPRVYQGVRVKTTVKELLQRHRAREANSKEQKTIPQSCLEFQDHCASTLPGHCVDAPAILPTQDGSACGAPQLQLRTASFPVPDGSCSIQMQESGVSDSQQQFGDMLPGNGYCGNNTCGSPYSATMPPPPPPLPPAAPLSWCHGLSSDADFYGHGMAPCSPDSLKLCSPMEHNSYSSQDSFSSSSSSYYDSPTRMESSCVGVASEHLHYQHCTLQDSYCLPPCWPAQQENLTTPEYVPYYSPTDYLYPYAGDDSCLRRDLTPEMCYNVL
ncbi:colorectal cancer-associated protein 2 [Thalassophryne amazonica]|uniref:colorectal cancer-associated protein 2 n=1 Tax=Thalassophryne amazonica TaxID=390379 RepID=UPI0014716046|nr:colorectal cancer-associated protein 2 [Thalassophryne amazonica]